MWTAQQWPRSRYCSGWSPRSAGSVPTRASSPASGSPPGCLASSRRVPKAPKVPPVAPVAVALVLVAPMAVALVVRALVPLAVAGGVSVALDTRGVIDVAAERARLEKDRAAAEKEAAQCRAKLDNPAFVGKAPDHVVAKIRDRLAAAEADLARINGQLDTLPA